MSLSKLPVVGIVNRKNTHVKLALLRRREIPLFQLFRGYALMASSFRDKSLEERNEHVGRPIQGKTACCKLDEICWIVALTSRATTFAQVRLYHMVAHTLGYRTVKTWSPGLCRLGKVMSKLPKLSRPFAISAL